MTPNIGVSCNVEDVKYGGLWMERVAMVPLTYVRAVARAGGRPLLIAPTPADLADPDALLDLLDGVLITGGADLAAESYGAEPHPQNGETDADHHVEVEPRSLAAIAAGDTRVAVRSYHHQGVERVGDGLRVTARAEGDATVEGIEDPTRRFMLGVLWHPEEDEADRLIGAFVQECRARAAAGA